MAINQTALNVEVINGKENFLYSQNLTVTSTIVALIDRVRVALVNLVASVVSSVSSLYKGQFKTLIVGQPAFDGTSPLNGMALNVSAINANDTRPVSSNASIIINYFFYKTYIATSTAVTSLVRAILEPNMFLVTVNSNSSVIKDVGKYLTSTLSTTISTLSRTLQLVRTISSSVTSLVTLIPVRIYYRTLNAISTITEEIVKSVQKPLTISVNCGIILRKSVLKLMNSSSTVLATLITSAISFTRYPVNRLIYAATKIRKVFYN